MFMIIIKGMLVLFMLAGTAATLYAALEIWHTVSFVQTSTGRAKATFAGYHREFHKSGGGTKQSYSVATYPEFTYQTDGGKTERVRESKVHVIALYKPGDEVEILHSSSGSPRMASFYSLYVRDILILAIGILALTFSLVFWNFALPQFTAPPTTYESSRDPIPTAETEPSQGPSLEIEKVFRDEILSALDFQIGPIKLRHILYGCGVLFLVVIILSTVQGLAPFVAQMRFGDRGRMLEAFEHRRYDEVREMIVKGKGIHAKNEFNQNPLLLALEARKPELARILIEAGADVNIKSKMYKTPILVSTQSRDLEMVKLLIAHGAIPDTPWDEEPPVFYALAKGYEDIAKVLIEASTDLDRRYQCGKDKITVEDLARIAKKPKLVTLIRQRHGSSDTPTPQLKNSVKKQIQPTASSIKEKAREKASKAEKAKHKAIVITDADKKIKADPPRQPSSAVQNKVEEKTNEISEILDNEIATDTEEKAQEEFTGEVKETDRDGRFISYNNGVVEDTETGLMWAARDNGADIAWEEAKSYCKNFKRAGYTDWRLPTLKEMKIIHGTGEEYPLGCKPSHTVKITRLITLTCSYPWTIDRSQKLAVSFDFCRKLRRSCPAEESENHRALPVRDNK